MPSSDFIVISQCQGWISVLGSSDLASRKYERTREDAVCDIANGTDYLMTSVNLSLFERFVQSFNVWLKWKENI